MMPPDRPFDPKLEARAKRRAKAVARKLEASAPLLLHAGLERVPTVAEAAAEVERHDADALAHLDGLESLQAQARAKGLELRARLATLVSPQRMAVLDARRATLPKEGAAEADFWFAWLRDEPLPLCAACEPLIAELHAADAAVYTRTGLLGRDALGRQLAAREAVDRHMDCEHGDGPSRHPHRPGCRFCRNDVGFLLMAEREAARGFGDPARLAHARASYERHQAHHAEIEAAAGQPTLGLEVE